MIVLLLALLLALPASSQDVESVQINVTVQPATGGTYQTNFDGTEYPISESGAWVHNGPAGSISPNKMEKYLGATYQVLSPPFGSYDGAAHLTGFPPDQWAEAVFYIGSPVGVQEGTLMVRANTYASGALSHTNPTTGSEPTTIRMYAMYWGQYSGGQGGHFGIGLWDGNMNERGAQHEAASPQTNFYGHLGQGAHPFTSPAGCTTGPKNGDTIRVTAQGQSPVALNGYLKRSGSSTWTQCGSTVYDDDNMVTTPDTANGSTIPWHQRITSGNPGITSFQNNGNVREIGYTSFSAGPCPALPASCAP